MNILQKIKQERKIQLQNEKNALQTPSLKTALLQDQISLIAELKKASPSAGIIAQDFKLLDLAQTYVQKGAAAFSVLTEEAYFKGSNAYLQTLRSAYPNMPILRKDFIFEPFSLCQSKFLGASAVLLIVNLLPLDELLFLHKLALDLDLEVLVEVHDKPELETALKVPNLAMLGINNRNLESFEVSLENSFKLIKTLPNNRDFALISESGFKTKQEANEAKQAGFDAVLVGESMVLGQF